MMKKGYPVNKIFEEEVKPIDSHRFDLLTPSKYKNSIIKINEGLMKENIVNNQNISTNNHKN